MAKQLFLIPLLFTFFLFAAPVHAQSTFMQDAADENKLDAKSNLGKFTTEDVNRIGYSLVAAAAGGDLLGLKNFDNYYGRGILPATTEYTASLFNRPIKTSVYVADVLKNANLIPQAYAQGIGFAGLNPILNIWKAFRNIAYFAFIVIFVVIGFMIMIRKKISNNAVVTIQEALPKIIITLLLITFSYAIAGLMVDLMYFSIFLLTGLFSQAQLITDATAANNAIFRRNIIGIGIKYFTGTTEPAGMAAEAIGQIVSQVFGGLGGGLANIIFFLIFLVAVIIAVFRTFIQLLTAYIGIITSTIFAPLQLLPNAFPGSDAFQKWIRGLFANVAVFPVAAAMVLLGLILSGDSDGNPDFGIPAQSNDKIGFDYEGFIPPLMYSAEVTNGNTGGGGGSVNAVQSLIGFGIIMLLPEVVKITKKTLKVEDSGFGEAAWKNAMAGQAPVSKVAGAPFRFVGKQIGNVVDQGVKIGTGIAIGRVVGGIAQRAGGHNTFLNQLHQAYDPNAAPPMRVQVVNTQQTTTNTTQAPAPAAQPAAQAAQTHIPAPGTTSPNQARQRPQQPPPQPIP